MTQELTRRRANVVKERVFNRKGLAGEREPGGSWEAGLQSCIKQKNGNYHLSVITRPNGAAEGAVRGQIEVF